MMQQHVPNFEKYFNEGLIKTVDNDKTVDILQRALQNWKIERDRYSTEFSNLYLNIDSFDISKKKFSKDIDKIVKLSNVLGWYISFILIDGEPYDNFSKKQILKDFKWVRNSPNISTVGVKLAKKFDMEVSIPRFVYHATPEKRWNKIKKIGLIPKSLKQSKNASGYSPRVYLAPETEAYMYASDFEERYNEGNWMILEIDTKKVPNMKLHKDPEFQDGTHWYTTDNIPPLAIKIKEILD